MQTGVTYVFLWNLIDSDIKDWIWRDKMIVNKRYFISNIYPDLPTFYDWIKQPTVYRIRVYWPFTTARVIVWKQIILFLTYAYLLCTQRVNLTYQQN